MVLGLEYFKALANTLVSLTEKDFLKYNCDARKTKASLRTKIEGFLKPGS